MAFTVEQNAVLDASGRIIVSASAGSGKTTVMIEKIIRLILSGVDVSDILAVTFTKKAASQMKDKLKRELIKAINSGTLSEQDRVRLKSQLTEVSSADISTIHSLCARLIRSHFFEAGVSGDFRIVSDDDAESVSLKASALDKIFERAYESDETGEFFKLLSVYWRKKSDKKLREIFLSSYSELRSRADYKTLLDKSGNYQAEDFDNVCEELFALLKDKCHYYASCVEPYEKYFEHVGGVKSATLATEIKNAFLEIAHAPNYFSAIRTPKATFTAKERTNGKSDEYVEKLSGLIAIRDKKYGGLLKEFAKIGSYEEEKGAFNNAGEIARALAKYLIEFDEEYTQLKRGKNILDYNDLEHVCLELLSVERVQNEVRNRYKYVFVDEYQDVNPVQEKLLSLIGGKNVFLVGDVKQAIYGFRGSKSKYFGEKQEEFSSSGGHALMLTRNFRSSDKVLDAVNAQFSSIMTEQTSTVEYAKSSIMERGGRYPEDSGVVQVHVLTTKEEKEQEKAKKKEEAQEQVLPVYSVRDESLSQTRERIKTARKMKEIIHAIVGSEFYDVEEGKVRKAKYSDIVVLSRKRQGAIKNVVMELTEDGVPVTSAAPVNICEYSEIKLLVDFLNILDNGEQDTPLVSVLLSALGKLDVEELALIRLAFKEEKYFRNACKRYANEKQDRIAAKLTAFFALYEEFRLYSVVATAGEVLSELLSKTDLEARILSRENGVACMERIRRFISETNEPEPLCLREFLEKLKNLDYKIENMESGGENSVQVLTMHSSKGLEYPFVIVDATTSFHGADRSETVLDERYGLAPKSYDPKEMTKRSTLLYRLFEERKSREELGDELNLYYVAMTRAKYGLHIIFKEQPELFDVAYAKSYGELTDFSVWEKYVGYGIQDEPERLERQALGGKPDLALTEKIIEEFRRIYPYAGVENLPVKNSATSLMESVFEEREEFVSTASEERPIYTEKTSAELGTAYHAFLEHFDFSLLSDRSAKEAVEFSFETQTAEGVLSEKTAELLSKDKLAEILSNPAFQKLQGMTLYKEQQFIASLPVCEIPLLCKKLKEEGCSDELLQEELLFQGAIDLLAIGNQGNVHIIDYKYSGRSAASIQEHYAPQLQLYKKVTARILKIPESNIKTTIINLLKGFEVEMC